MAEHSTRFTTNYCLKTWQEQQDDNSTDDIYYLQIFADLNSPLPPKLPDKDARLI